MHFRDICINICVWEGMRLEMQIKNMQINNFGKLKNKEIELANGINVVYGENESGKSTLLKFITSMFYGINKNKNGKRISDYDRYFPWEEGEFSGRIIYEVYRNFTKKNPQILDKSGNDISKEYTIDKTSGNKFFMEQTKVDEDLFNMSMVIMQQEVKLDDKKQNELIQKASNIMLTGEDDVSYKNIMSKLNKRQGEEIGTEKSPTKPLYQTKQKIEALRQTKQEINDIEDYKYEIEEEKTKFGIDIKQAEKELELMHELQQMQNEESIEEERINVNIKSKEEIEDKKKEEEQKLENIKTNKIQKKNKKILYVMPLVLTIIAVVLYFLSQKTISIILLSIGILSLFAIMFINFKENNKQKKLIEEEKHERKNIESKIEVLENEIRAKQKAITEMQSNLNLKNNLDKEKLKLKYKEIQDIEDLIGKKISSSNIIDEQKYINDLKLKLTELEMKKEDITKKCENASEVEEKLNNYEDQLKELLEYNEAINIAKEALDKAYTEMKENVTPEFTQNLSKAIQNISNNKYKTVKVSDESGLMVETKNGNYIPADMLSIGTIDQLYLSLRISSINELTKENMPIILDETFAYFDRERLVNVLEFLNQEYKNRQIIILTCTNREMEALETKEIPYNKIVLQIDKLPKTRYNSERQTNMEVIYVSKIRRCRKEI